MLDPLADNDLRTRDDHADAVRSIVDALVPHWSPGGARIDLGHRGTFFSKDAAALESFARPLWAVAALSAGGFDFDHWDLYRRGLTAGVDPEHPEYWGSYDTTDQRMVEQAAIGWALAVVPDQLWGPLGDRSQQQVAEWLSLIDRAEPFGNNWQFFRILVHLGLDTVGVGTDTTAGERSLAKIHENYLGDGWYRDGPLGTCDLYVPCAFHYYGLLYAAMRDDEHADAFRTRAREFATDWAAWFDDRGDVVPFGRSLTYRFVTGAFWAALAAADEEALPWGQTRGLLGRHLRTWSGRDIWRSDGTLSVGYGYEQDAVGEEYISSGSPYWAMKSFAALATPADHAFWTTDEDPHASHGQATVKPQSHPGMLLCRSPDQVVALSGRHSAGNFVRGEDRYAKFAYSSRYGFSLGGDVHSPHERAPDSMLALSEGHGPWRVRRTTEAWQIEGDDAMWCEWSPWPDVHVCTVLWAAPAWHVRLHAVESGRALVTTEGGSAIGFGGSGARGPAPVQTIDGPVARVATASDKSLVRSLDDIRGTSILAPLPNTNLRSPRTLLPVLTGAIDPGEHVLAGLFAAGPASTEMDLDEPPEVPDRILALVDR